MNSRTFFLTVSAGLILTGCGVDMTGLSAESSRKPLGPASALVTVTEYADLQCPACASAYTLVNQPLMEKYGSRVKFEFKHFPLTSIHAFALEAAQAAECAADQGKFWEFVDTNYLNQKDLTSSEIRKWGTTLGLDGDLFDRCIRSGIKKDTVMADFAQGENLGVRGTPTFFVNGTRTESSMEAISAAIDAATGQAQSVPL